MPFVPAKCTQCGANIEVDSSKDAGICKYCGTAFITEKAINNYNITVTNNYDGANINIIGGNIDNLLTLTQAAIDASNFKEAYDYSNKVLEIDASSAKAWVFKMQATGGLGTIADPKVNEIINYGKKAMSLSEESEQSNLEQDVYTCWLKIANTYMTAAFNAVSNMTDLVNQLQGLSTLQKVKVGQADISFRDTISNLSQMAIDLALTVPASYCSNHPELSEEYISLSNQYLQYCNKDVTRLQLCNLKLLPGAVESRKANLDSLKTRIPTDKHSRVTGPELRTGSACYIATSVYGSYDCPEVWTLRRFRDYYLDEHSLGRIFIKCYYTISPHLVNTFGNTSWFRNIFRTLLNHLILKLKAIGYKDTPYHDKY